MGGKRLESPVIIYKKKMEEHKAVECNNLKFETTAKPHQVSPKIIYKIVCQKD